MNAWYFVTVPALMLSWWVYCHLHIDARARRLWPVLVILPLASLGIPYRRATTTPPSTGNPLRDGFDGPWLFLVLNGVCGLLAALLLSIAEIVLAVARPGRRDHPPRRRAPR